MRVGLHTLGCKLNFSETSIVSRQFEERGFIKVDFSEAADVYVINTCSVTENADKKCRKVVRDALRRNPDAFVVVMGCYAQLKPKEISEIPGVDIVLGAKEKFKLFDLVGDFSKQLTCRVEAGKITETKSFEEAFSLGDRTRSFLKIQDGCDYKCTFCTIPLARGKSRSDSMENILKNAKTIAQAGVKEIVLTGVNIGDYGKEMDVNFLDVIRALDEVEGIDRYRISSIEPNLLTDEIIAFVASSKRFMPHFHIPLQSGSDEILGRMRRRYKRDLYGSRVEEIRRLIPDAAIGVDVIVGFPGETDELFQETANFIASLEVSYLHVFTYSERNSTIAETLEGKIPLRTRMERNEILRNLSEKKREAHHRRYIGTTRKVLFESADKNGMMEGFSDNHLTVKVPFREDWVNSIREVQLDVFEPGGWIVANVPLAIS